jgi:hypothetical protein
MSQNLAFRSVLFLDEGWRGNRDYGQSVDLEGGRIGRFLKRGLGQIRQVSQMYGQIFRFDGYGYNENDAANTRVKEKCADRSSRHT